METLKAAVPAQELEIPDFVSKPLSLLPQDPANKSPMPQTPPGSPPPTVSTLSPAPAAPLPKLQLSAPSVDKGARNVCWKPNETLELLRAGMQQDVVSQTQCV